MGSYISLTKREFVGKIDECILTRLEWQVTFKRNPLHVVLRTGTYGSGMTTYISPEISNMTEADFGELESLCRKICPERIT